MGMNGWRPWKACVSDPHTPMRGLRTRPSPGAGEGIGSSRNSMVWTAVTTMRRLMDIDVDLSRWVVPATSSDDSGRPTGQACSFFDRCANAAGEGCTLEHNACSFDFLDACY